MRVSYGTPEESGASLWPLTLGQGQAGRASSTVFHKKRASCCGRCVMETLALAWPWEERGGGGSSPAQEWTFSHSQTSVWSMWMHKNQELGFLPFPFCDFLPLLLSHLISTMFTCFQMEEQRLRISCYISQASIISNLWVFNSAGGTFSF